MSKQALNAETRSEWRATVAETLRQSEFDDMDMDEDTDVLQLVAAAGYVQALTDHQHGDPIEDALMAFDGITKAELELAMEILNDLMEETR